MTDIGFWNLMCLLEFIYHVRSAVKKFQFHTDSRYWQIRNRHRSTETFSM